MPIYVKECKALKKKFYHLHLKPALTRSDLPLSSNTSHSGGNEWKF